MKQILVITILTFNLSAFSKIKNKPLYTDTKNQLKHYGQKVETIKKEISQIDLSLNNKNSKFINIIEKRNKLNNTISILEKELEAVKESIKDEYVETKHNIAELLMYEVDENESTVDFLQKQVISKALEEKLDHLKSSVTQAKTIQNNLEDIKEKYIELQSIEVSLGQMLFGLEKKKQRLADQYLGALKKHSETIDNLKLKRSKIRKLSRKVTNLFSSPLAGHFRVKEENQGIRYSFIGTRPIKAPGRGKVYFIGNLSTLGKVLMIEHENDMRSILLGHFSPKIKLRDKVEEGQIVGYTNIDARNLYYEVRKKSKKQKTIDWIRQI